MNRSVLVILVIVIIASILIGGALLIFPVFISYIVDDSHERCIEVHLLF